MTNGSGYSLSERLAAWTDLYGMHGRRYGDSEGLLLSWARPILNGQRRVLDVGCGYGRDTRAIGSEIPEAQMLGVDGASTAISLAETMAPMAQFLCANACDSAVWQTLGCFDLVYCNFLTHLLLAEERCSLLSGIASALDSRGHLVMNFVSVNDHFYRKGDQVEDDTFMVWPGRFWHFFSAPEVVELLHNVGLRQLQMEELIEDESIDGVANQVTFWAVIAGHEDA